MPSFIKRFVPAGSAVLTATAFGSYGLGLLRDRIFAQTFGLSVDLDAYNAAFLLPDFLFNLLVASGIAAAMVPLFSALKREGYAQAYEYVGSIINTALITTGVVAAGLMVLAGPASHLVAPGLAETDQQAVVRLMRVLSLSPLLFSLSNSLGAMLVAERRFLYYGLSPMLYNLGIIAGVLALAPRFGVMGAALGTLGGASLHAGIRLFDARRLGWRWHWVLGWKTPSFRKTIRLMLPKMIGHPVELVTFWAYTALASTRPAGSISALNFARNFQSVPVSLIGITMSTAAFPLLADAIAGQRTSDFVSVLRRILGSILVISAAAAVVLYLIREPLIALLLGGGSFDAEAIKRTAQVLGIFCLAIPTESINHLLARAFYARHNTVVPVVFSMLALLVAVSVAWIFLPSVGITALPAGFFAGSLIKTLGLTGWLYGQSLKSADD
ncbi:MAG: hypothetical protein COT71_02880 [Candidatus Andersenbacteria bacterium CG10_big_fil_rev_8_21_14_0_10_54_11]|uniref:Murein biosynthesis integral membrane protein MurJ n=1 Tax=Candidatus Andersenbacteria bacterium CG10_big_fil_rev_8_21_14_0_10_54_11 TaxID=1974485 RepID=A0A2M6WZ00_9BACT|nr:MAG: hypothetical protein COT71_02880 [Candidatus Andersenbacteria bacterium CG10_big_fil_rev_8_21_14_0_10_54_11]